MMLLSVVIGALHLVLANLVTAWRYRHSPRFLAPLGWVAMIFGGLLMGMKMTGGDALRLAVPIDVFLLVGGALSVLLFSSARPWSFNGIGDLVWRVVDGLTDLTNVTKAFGDVLSYLRLFALGLASAKLAQAFNDIAAGVSKLPALGLVAAILVLAIGHGLNFLLAVMGGVVHGLRLNCIEFFNWSLPEEGYPFQAFCKKASQ
jgi:V/A-type H+-transporting ATPase subunit I